MYTSYWGKGLKGVFLDVQDRIEETENWEAWLKQRSQAEHVVFLSLDGFVSRMVTRGVKPLSQTKIRMEIDE